MVLLSKPTLLSLFVIKIKGHFGYYIVELIFISINNYKRIQ